jgi:acyl dehydratase
VLRSQVDHDCVLLIRRQSISYCQHSHSRSLQPHWTCGARGAKNRAMPLDSSLVGTKVAPIASEIDARWAMAYAASLDDYLPCYLDTRRPAGIVAHPMFAVCFEWPAAGSIRHKARASLAQDEAVRGVHATHRTIIHRLLHPPERLITTAELIGVERRKRGAYEVAKFETADDEGAPVCTTYYGSLYREVNVKGPDRPAETPPLPRLTHAGPARNEIRIPISAGAAHVYTECARIWNPIHTDSAIAAKAGLPGLILHGTATLAMAVSRIIEAEAGGNPDRVAQIYGRFGAMVLMPSEVLLRIEAREKCDGGEAVFFEAISAGGGRAIRDGVVVLRD